jgi:hypothetical protein
VLVLTAISLEARTVSRSVGAIAALAMAPTVVVAIRGGHDFAGALTAASVIAGAGAGYSVDDPAAPTLAPSPTPLAVRRCLRATVVMAALVAAWLAALVIARTSAPALPAIATAMRELVATAAIAAAVASRARSDAPASPGAAAAGASVLAMVTISAFAYRWPALPALGSGPTHSRWWWVAAAGFVAAAWSSRDPATSGLRCYM